MKIFLPATAALLCQARAFSGFSNVTHVETATIAMGIATSFDGLTMIAPGSSDGASIGFFESFDGGASVEYDDASVGYTSKNYLYLKIYRT